MHTASAPSAARASAIGLTALLLLSLLSPLAAAARVPEATLVFVSPADGSVFGRGETIDFAVLYTCAKDPSRPILEYGWSMGDGTEATTEAPSFSHAYTSGGAKTVSVTITKPGGCKDIVLATRTITITNLAPTVALGAPTGILEEGQTVSLTATGADADGSVASYAWTVDGVAQPETGSTLSRTYPAGTRTVSVVATDNDGASSAPASQTFLVAAAPELPAPEEPAPEEPAPEEPAPEEPAPEEPAPEEPAPEEPAPEEPAPEEPAPEEPAPEEPAPEEPAPEEPAPEEPAPEEPAPEEPAPAEPAPEEPAPEEPATEEPAPEEPAAEEPAPEEPAPEEPAPEEPAPEEPAPEEPAPEEPAVEGPAPEEPAAEEPAAEEPAAEEPAPEEPAAEEPAAEEPTREAPATEDLAEPDPVLPPVISPVPEVEDAVEDPLLETEEPAPATSEAPATDDESESGTPALAPAPAATSTTSGSTTTYDIDASRRWHEAFQRRVALVLEGPTQLEPGAVATYHVHAVDAAGQRLDIGGFDLVYTAPTTPGVYTVTADYWFITGAKTVRVGEEPVAVAPPAPELPLEEPAAEPETQAEPETVAEPTAEPEVEAEPPMLERDAPIVAAIEEDDVLPEEELETPTDDTADPTADEEVVDLERTAVAAPAKDAPQHSEVDESTSQERGPSVATLLGLLIASILAVLVSLHLLRRK